MHIGRNTGLIQITLKENMGEVTLIIQDNGSGLPEGFDIDNQEGFGLMLVRMLLSGWHLSILRLVKRSGNLKCFLMPLWRISLH